MRFVKDRSGPPPPQNNICNAKTLQKKGWDFHRVMMTKGGKDMQTRDDRIIPQNLQAALLKSNAG
jgi:hypothetical protein